MVRCSHESVFRIRQRNPDVHHLAFVGPIALATNLCPSLDRHWVANPHRASITFKTITHHIHEPSQSCRVLCKLGYFFQSCNKLLHTVAPVHVRIEFLCADVETHLPGFRSHTGSFEKCADTDSFRCHDVCQKLQLCLRQHAFGCGYWLVVGNLFWEVLGPCRRISSLRCFVQAAITVQFFVRENHIILFQHQASHRSPTVYRSQFPVEDVCLGFVQLPLLFPVRKLGPQPCVLAIDTLQASRLSFSCFACSAITALAT
mmetsp:Transcript_14117/g.34311  ORF Transcript_14117/g.34311 Transcript_14117/m.34311 type:complete len:259 (-) Transcript_14117:265-1041(-)